VALLISSARVRLVNTGPFAQLELADERSRIGPGDVRGNEVGGELHPLEGQARGLGEAIAIMVLARPG